MTPTQATELLKVLTRIADAVERKVDSYHICLHSWETGYQSGKRDAHSYCDAPAYTGPKEPAREGHVVHREKTARTRWFHFFGR